MASDLFRQPFESSVASRLNARWNTHRKALRSEMPSPEHKQRLPAWARLTKEGTDLSIEMGQEYIFFTERYEQTHFRPNVPSLTQISITRDSGRGYNINLALTVTVEFEVYTYEQFNQYAQEFLRRDQFNPIKLEWGNVETYSGRGLLKHTLGGMFIVSGGYSTTPSNTYICTFKAIAAAEAIKGFDIYKIGNIVERLNDTLKEINSQTIGSTSTHEYNGIADVINTHFLVTGETTLTDGMKSIEVPSTSPAISKYLKGGTIGAVYKPSPEMDMNTEETKDNNQSSKIGSNSQRLEYMTLEYLVALLQVGVLDYYNDSLGFAKDSNARYRLTFSDTTEDETSYSIIPQDAVSFLFKSCNPRDILFLGEGCGTYLTTTNPSRGQDFEENISSNLKAVTRENGGYKINHRKILISKAFVLDLLVSDVSSTYNSNQASNKSQLDTTANRTSERRLTVRTFLDNVFAAIAKASGGFVGLSLQINRGSQDNVTNLDFKAPCIMQITDSSFNSKVGDIRVWEFDPLIGDGNLLTLQLTADLARDLLDVALWQNTKTNSGTANKEQTKIGGIQLTRQQVDCLLAANALTVQDEKKGLWSQFITSGFSTEKGNAIASKLEELTVCISNSQARKETPPEINGFMPVRLTADMEGIFPIRIGNLFSSTNLPEHQKLKKNGIAIVCTQVTDTIAKPGVWTTQIQGMMTALPKNTPYLNQFDTSGISSLTDTLTSARSVIANNPFNRPALDILGRPR